MNKISGVYKITNTITGEFYIGSSKDIKHRWNWHKSSAVHHKYPNSKMFKDMDEYGKDKFNFEIIEETTILREREQYWIDELKPTYNVRHAKIDEVYKKVYQKEYNNRLCEFEGKILKFSILKGMFIQKGIIHPNQEAKKYLLHSN